MPTSNDKINKLILDYFIHEGYEQAAVRFSKELDLDLDKGGHQHTRHSSQNDLVAFTPTNQFITNINQINNEREFSDMVVHYYNDNKNVAGRDARENTHDNHNFTRGSSYSSIVQRQEIKALILSGEITEAIKRISQYYPMILDLNNLLHFKLLRLNLVEMIRNHKFNNVVDQSEKEFLATILQFVRENLINKVSNLFKLLKELEITMSLLCFRFDPNITNLEDQVDLPEDLKKIFNLSLRNQCYRLVNQAILKLHSDDDGNDALFEIGRKEVGIKAKESLIDDILEGDGELNQRKMTTTYHGPKFAEFDLSSLDKYNTSNVRTAGALLQDKIGPAEEQQRRGDEEDDDGYYDDDSDFDDDVDIDTIEYTINTNGSIFYKADNDDNGAGENSFAVRDNDDEITKLTDLSLESKLEKVIKLWILTEQRMVDLNLLPAKNFKNILQREG
ncbi:Glucose-induced degradation protein 8 [Candida viswanathii]|uniref:Glucose-induced degradation protein 8 n=1 Tax=Candida viswanathii TaxID=5486 RepID=A0A367Y013_9ASCO|nr:Glucose-induced degradation protein 8 [Candida viswanathii]